MIPIVTPEEMAAIDATAALPVDELIRRAGGHVFRQAVDLLGGTYGRRVVVLAGKGNNGNDGREAARRLAAAGVRVEVIDAATAPPHLPPADLVIDAAFGTGLRGPYEPPDAGGAPVLAVDIPSGVDGLTGRVQGGALGAVRTVTFQALKPGVVLQPGAALAGDVKVVDIGLDVTGASVGLVQQVDVVGWWPRRAPDDHKWSHAVYVVAGSPGMVGAAHLTAAGALRAGAGMVRLGLRGDAFTTARPPVEVVTRQLGTGQWDLDVIGDLGRFHALVIGPGVGRQPDVTEALRRIIAAAPVPAVVDADALFALGTSKQAREVIEARAHATVLTPHRGEFAGLFGDPSGDDLLGEVRRLAADTGATVLLKGSTTVIGDPDGRVLFVANSDERLATPGTGDVLSGVIGAALAGGLDGLEAAAASAWLHGAAAALGPRAGLMASDLLTHLPTVVSAVTKP